jgi:hypothetical protein
MKQSIKSIKSSLKSKLLQHKNTNFKTFSIDFSSHYSTLFTKKVKISKLFFKNYLSKNKLSIAKYPTHCTYFTSSQEVANYTRQIETKNVIILNQINFLQLIGKKAVTIYLQSPTIIILKVMKLFLNPLFRINKIISKFA